MSDENANASPRPWYVGGPSPDSGNFFLCRADSVSVGAAWREADARLVCECVNGWGLLQAYIRQLAQVVEERCGGADGPFRELLHRARAVAGCAPRRDGREGEA